MLRNPVLFLLIICFSETAFAIKTLHSKSMHEVKDTNALLAMHAQAMAEKQAVLATNIANANTPGYIAEDVDIENSLKKDAKRGVRMNLTSNRHMNSVARSRDIKTYKLAGEKKPNGNNVNLADQMSRIGRASDKYNEIIRTYMASNNLIAAATGAGQ